MKQKLWIMYWVLAATAIFVGIETNNFWLMEGIAIAAAAAGWAAFLRP